MTPAAANTLLRSLATALARDGECSLATCVELGLSLTGVDKVKEAWAVATDIDPIAYLSRMLVLRCPGAGWCSWGCPPRCEKCLRGMRRIVPTVTTQQVLAVRRRAA